MKSQVTRLKQRKQTARKNLNEKKWEQNKIIRRERERKVERERNNHVKGKERLTSNNKRKKRVQVESERKLFKNRGEPNYIQHTLIFVTEDKVVHMLE